ncbi:hypothetical protein GUITHDRAFT_147093 [Guillardia theta CCMP2712]|uniref:Uncharacterized protein n=1 Tax=Guillardia theta (strain CCMP2712) TaxID=905079 RepID=L1IFD6_GUITC|nr:hypothetical protein GUITHDRAFT_147093 [Guillardia theta CCMP2712]EKX34570.1 hypothetical protein GUITHDRAFT_147093 [Guillardia theta CCMP2712]|eukprot:XP_005821550.1 hypothetical protein GUITHDRAFT_147093 [Guillardia theta CCMP2712]
MECERQRECHAYIFFGLKTEDGERAGRCFGKMWRAGERIEWLPRAYLHATCGFVPSTASKYSQSKFGRTSLLWLLRTAVERMISSSFWAISELSSHPQILGGIVATLLTLAWLLHYIKTRRELPVLLVLLVLLEEMKRVEQKREEYRQAELRRIREEVSERERQKELSKQLKRELWEAEKLEEERKKKEIEANEILLRERMQNKYNHLEQKKRTAREQKKKEEEEKKRKQQEEELKRRLPAL